VASRADDGCIDAYRLIGAAQSTRELCRSNPGEFSNRAQYIGRMRAFAIALFGFALGLGAAYLAMPERPAHPHDPSDLSWYLDTIPKLDAPTGSGRITGVVRDAQGAPIAGVWIVANGHGPGWSHQYERGGDPPAERVIEDLIREEVQHELWSREVRRTATSGVEGRFTIERVPDLSYSVEGYKRGYAFESDDAWEARPGSEVHFTGTPQVRLKVKLDGFTPKLDDDLRIEWTRFENNSARTSSAERWSPERPWVTLGVGEYRLQAKVRRGEVFGASEAQRVTLVAGQNPTPLHLPIRFAATIRVRISTPPGFADNKISVSAQRLGARGEAIGRPETDRATAPLVIPGLEPGTYEVTAAWVADRSGGTTKRVEVGGGISEVELELEAPDPKKWIVLRVEGADGEVLQDARYGQKFSAGTGDGHGSGMLDVIHHQDGRCFLAPLDTDGMSGTFEVDVSHKDYGRLTRAVVPSAEDPVVIRFAAPAFVDATVSGYAAAGCRCRLRLVPESEGSWQWGHDSTAEEPKLATDGTQRLGPAQPGAHNLVLFLETKDAEAIPGGGWTRVAYLAHDRVVLQSGVRAVRIGIPQLHTVRVKWVGEGKRSFRLRPVTKEQLVRRNEWVGTVGDDGFAEFRFVPAGNYEVNGQRIEVPKQLEVTVR